MINATALPLDPFSNLYVRRRSQHSKRMSGLLSPDFLHQLSSLLPVSFPPTFFKTGKPEQERERERKWQEAKLFHWLVPSSRFRGRKFGMATRTDATWASGMSLCFLRKGYHGRDAPGCRAFCCGPETYCCGEASWSDTTDFPSPHFILWFAFIAQAWSSHLWLKLMASKWSWKWTLPRRKDGMEPPSALFCF